MSLVGNPHSQSQGFTFVIMDTQTVRTRAPSGVARSLLIMSELLPCERLIERVAQATDEDSRQDAETLKGDGGLRRYATLSERLEYDGQQEQELRRPRRWQA